MARFNRLISLIAAALLSAACAQDPVEQVASPAATNDQEVLVFGSIEAIVEWLQAEQWWGDIPEDSALAVPRIMLTGIAPNWRYAAQDIPVPDKKAIFYRFMLPLVLHANEMVLERRARLEQMAADVAAGKPLADEQLELLRAAAVLLRIGDADTAADLGDDPAAINAVIDEALHKLDVIPRGRRTRRHHCAHATGIALRAGALGPAFGGSGFSRDIVSQPRRLTGLDRG